MMYFGVDIFSFILGFFQFFLSLVNVFHRSLEAFSHYILEYFFSPAFSSSGTLVRILALLFLAHETEAVFATRPTPQSIFSFRLAKFY